MRRYRFGLTVTTITADHAEAGEIQAAAADLFTGSPAIESVTAGPMTTEPVAPKVCRGRDLLHPNHPARRRTRDLPRALVRRADRHATARYQPLIDALHQATGLQSTVWQSGGMTMMLLTGPRAAEPYQGRHYLTLVDHPNDDATLEGSTGWYDYDRDPNTEGSQVFLADRSLAGSAAAPHHAEGLVADRALTPTEWAQVIGRHWAALGAPDVRRQPLGTVAGTDYCHLLGDHGLTMLLPSHGTLWAVAKIDTAAADAQLGQPRCSPPRGLQPLPATP